MERIYIFLPSIMTLACIAGVTIFCLMAAIKRLGDNYKSIEWRKNNRQKVRWTIDAPMMYVWVPALEELIFRAPIIIAFDTMSSSAWYGVFASSTIFAIMHRGGTKISLSEIISEKENSNHKSDNMIAEVGRLYTEKEKMMMVRKMLNVILVLFLGILAGYYGIIYQSIWMAFGIHMAWNLIMPTTLQFLTYLGMLLVVSILSLLDGMRR